MASRKRAFVTPEEHIELLKSEISDLRTENDKLTDLLASAMVEITDLKTEVSQLTQSCANLRNVIEFRDETIQKMKLDMEENYQKVDLESEGEDADEEDDEDNEDEDEDENIESS